MNKKTILLELILVLTCGFIIFSAPIVSAATLQEDYQAGEKINLLIVPGHDNDPASGGTRFGGLTEAELNLQLSWQIYQLFQKDARFNVGMTRNSSGYNEPLASYFVNNRDQIISFRNSAKATMQELLRSGQIWGIISPSNVAGEEASIKLHGINKWINENGFNMALHVHFNDYPGRRSGQKGIYSGFVVLVPERQLPNHAASWPMGNSLYAELKKFFPVSNQVRENPGLVEDQELIALGSNRTLKSDVASVLIEYGYIYESAWMNPVTRPAILKELAYRTYAGIKKYFEPDWKNESVALPYIWLRQIRIAPEAAPDILALQIALTKDGLYPPLEFYRNDCPLSGVFGRCTRRAIINFQAKYGIPKSGHVDAATLRKINQVYSYSVSELLTN